MVSSPNLARTWCLSPELALYRTTLRKITLFSCFLAKATDGREQNAHAMLTMETIAALNDAYRQSRAYQ